MSPHLLETREEMKIMEYIFIYIYIYIFIRIYVHEMRFNVFLFFFSSFFLFKKNRRSKEKTIDIRRFKKYILHLRRNDPSIYVYIHILLRLKLQFYIEKCCHFLTFPLSPPHTPTPPRVFFIRIRDKLDTSHAT